MCTSVILRDGTTETECTNHGELTEALGGAPLYKHPDDEPPAPNQCLCNFDAEATARQYGYTFDSKDPVWGDITLTKVQS